MSIKYENAKASHYIFAIVVASAIWAMPVTSGGWHDLSSWIVYGYAYTMAILLTIAMFASPLDSLTKASPVINWVSRIVSWGGVAWLAYHGHDWLPALLAYGFLMGYAHRDRAIKAAE